MGGRVRVIVCGSRNWKDEEAIHARLEQLPREGLVIANGGARGADRIAWLWAEDHGVDVETFVARWDDKGRAAGPIRNLEMLGYAPTDLVLAFRSEGESRGTDHMCTIAARRGVPVEVTTPGAV